MEEKIKKIVSLIASKGVTKAKVAERCGINAATLSKIISGKIKYAADSRIDRIVDYLESINTNEV